MCVWCGVLIDWCTATHSVVAGTEGKQFVAPKLVKLPPRPAASAADTKSDTKSGAATATATATATAAGSGSGSGGDSKDEKIAAALIAAVKPTTPYGTSSHQILMESWNGGGTDLCRSRLRHCVM